MGQFAVKQKNTKMAAILQCGVCEETFKLYNAKVYRPFFT